MNQLHFGSDAADSRIRIRINPEIRIRMPNTFGWGNNSSRGKVGGKVGGLA